MKRGGGAASCAIFLGVILAGSAAVAQAVRGADDQLWSELDLTGRVSDRLELTATLVDRQGDGLPNPTLWGGGVTADFRLAPHWSIGAGDDEVQVRIPPSGFRLSANLPLAYVTGDWWVAGYHLSDRNRVEDIVGAPGNPWRSRHRVMVERPLPRALPFRSVFISDEVFYDFSRRRLSRNRAQIGMTLATGGPTALQVYVMRQDDNEARPGVLNSLGLSVKVALN
jgi:hypothetical protein